MASSVEQMFQEFTKRVLAKNGEDGGRLAGILDEVRGEVDMSKYEQSCHHALRQTPTCRKVDSKGQCIARTWAGGSGLQCSRSRVVGEEFCKMHGIKAAETTVPLTRDDKGRARGLYFGRIDEDVPYKFQLEDGSWEIRDDVWSCEDTHRKIREAIVSGIPRGLNMGQAKYQYKRALARDSAAVPYSYRQKEATGSAAAGVDPEPVGKTVGEQLDHSYRSAHVSMGPSNLLSHHPNFPPWLPNEPGLGYV